MKVGDTVIFHSPFTGDDVKVQFRGKIGAKATVIMNGMQMQVDVAALRPLKKNEEAEMSTRTSELVEQFVGATLTEGNQGVKAGFWQDAIVDWLREEFMPGVVSAMPKRWKVASAKAKGQEFEGEIKGPDGRYVIFTVSPFKPVARSVAMWIYDAAGNERKVEISQRQAASDIAKQIMALIASDVAKSVLRGHQ
jgi:hypothetical protein